MISDSDHADANSTKRLGHEKDSAPTRVQPIRRRLSFRRRRRLPTIRLGGKKPRRGSFVVRVFRRVKMRCLKLKCSGMLKKLKIYYRSLVKDIFEAAGTIEAIQQRMILEAGFAVPVMGLSFNSISINHHMS